MNNPLNELECFSWKTKFKKRTKNNKTMGGFFFLMMSHFLLQQFYVFPSIFPEEYGLKAEKDPKAKPEWTSTYILIMIANICFAMCVIFDIGLSYSNPGYLSPTVLDVSDTESEEGSETPFRAAKETTEGVQYEDP